MSGESCDNNYRCNSNREAANIIACICELKKTIAYVVECLDCDCTHGLKERIMFCILLEEINKIEAKLDNPKFGLNEIKNEVRVIENAVFSPKFGLNEIKQEIIVINETLSLINQTRDSFTKLTTGPVIAAENANNLIVKVLNNTSANHTVRIKVFDLKECPKCINEVYNQPLGPIVSSCASETSLIDLNPPSKGRIDEYEVEISGVIPGIYVWSSAFPGTDPKGSIDTNTFTHADFVGQVYNNC